MKEWFEDWFDSPYYHLLYKNRSDVEAKEFVDTIVRHFHLGTETVLLDLACGKGRHSIAFAAHGLDVTGVDLSMNSIEHASQFEHDKLHFYVHDMRHTFRANYFDIVCNLFTSFGYFNSAHDNLLAAQSMFHAVKKDGLVLVDFVNRNDAIRSIDSKHDEMIEVGDVRFTINRSYTAQRFVKKITIDDQGKQSCFEESLNSFSLEEMNEIFSAAGLTLLETFGNYQLSPYDPETSTRMILVFKK